MRAAILTGKWTMFRSTFVLLGLATVVGGCRAKAGGIEPEECRPTTATALPEGATAEGLAGEYQVTLVAERGEHQGQSVSGRLWLERYEGDLRQRTGFDGSPDTATVYAAFGATDVDVPKVGAVQPGSMESRDPMRPGVLVMEWRRTAAERPSTHITLRLGSEANRRDRQRVDGGYTALRVRQITAGGFSGTWGSGVTREGSGGYFCAVRLDG